MTTVRAAGTIAGHYLVARWTDGALDGDPPLTDAARAIADAGTAQPIAGLGGGGGGLNDPLGAAACIATALDTLDRLSIDPPLAPLPHGAQG